MNLKASLNKSAYTHGENVNVTIDVKNDSRKVVRKIRVSFNLCKRINGRETFAFSSRRLPQITIFIFRSTFLPK